MVSSAGAITDDYLYKAFGNELIVSGSTVNPLRFGGQVGYWRDEVERVYVRARHLRTDLGRWVSRDPFSRSDFNLYRYVKNGPVKGIDPSGLYVVLIQGGNGLPPPHMNKLANYIEKRWKERVFQPTYDWRFGIIPKPYPPDSTAVVRVLMEIYDWIEENPGESSDPCHIWVYGHSYGGHIAGQIANAGTSSVSYYKRHIERYDEGLGVIFTRYVTSVGDALDYPLHFSYVNVNLYTLAGDLELFFLNKAWWDSPWFWFNPEHYNTRHLRRTSRWPERYWLEGGIDRIIQPWYTSPPYFYHVSFNGEEDLTPHQSSIMIKFITRYLMENRK